MKAKNKKGGKMNKGLIKKIWFLTILTFILCIPVTIGVTQALAVVGSGTFELDGNSVDVPAGVLPDDFDCVYSGCSSALISSFNQDSDATGDPDTTTFGQGDKDTQYVQNWQCNIDNNVLAKDNILYAYAAAYNIAGDLVVFFGSDRERTQGSANVGFWFFQNQVGCTSPGNFTGSKTDGDLFIVSEFDSGGRVSNVNVYVWIDDPDGIPSTPDACLGDPSGPTCDVPFITGNDCVTGTSTDIVCATVNGDGDTKTDNTINAAWRSGIPENAYYEGGVNLTAIYELLGRDLGCFTGYMAQSRTSFELGATIKDYVLGDISTCGSITVIKQTDPEDSPQTFDFTLSPDPNSEGTQSLADNGTFTWSDLKENTYVLSETNIPSDWNLAKITCTEGANVTIDIGAGTATITLGLTEDVSCTFTNTQKAQLTVVKVVNNNHGGTAVAGDFTVRIDGNPVTSGQPNTLNAGNYVVDETNIPQGYQLVGITGDCDSEGNVTLNPGDNKTCTITNEDIAPQLTVIKHVINDNGGTAVAGNFTMNVTGTNVSNPSFPGAESPGTTVTLNAGAYSVDEAAFPGYAKTIGANCSGTIAVGETKTCTITNEDIAPTLTVIKYIINSTGPDPGLFNLQIDSVTSASDVGDSGTTGAVPVTAGIQHTVGETAGTGTSLDDYVTVIGGDCAEGGTITLVLDQDATCTITNTAKGKVEVVKTFQGSPITGSESFEFQLRTGASTSSDGTPIETQTVDASDTSGGITSVEFATMLTSGDEYQLCEFINVGWDSTLRADPNAFVPNSSANPSETDNAYVCVPFTVLPGETKTLSYDNTPPPGGMAKTIGFWKNWTSCDGHGNQDFVLDDTLWSFPSHGVYIGLLFVDSCMEAINILNKSTQGGDKKANDAAYNMAAQLLAAKLNVQAGAGTCTAVTDAIADAQNLLDNIGFTGNGDYLGPKVKGTAKNTRMDALDLAGILDAYNNNILCP
jgi:hypothetical protein